MEGGDDNMLSTILAKLPQCDTRLLCHTGAGPTEAVCRLADIILNQEESDLVTAFMTKRLANLGPQKRDKFLHLFEEVSKYIKDMRLVVVQQAGIGPMKTIDSFPRRSQNSLTTPELYELLSNNAENVILLTIDTELSEMVHFRCFKNVDSLDLRLDEKIKQKLVDHTMHTFEKKLTVDDIPESAIRMIIRNELSRVLAGSTDSGIRAHLPIENPPSRPLIKNTTIFDSVRSAVSQL